MLLVYCATPSRISNKSKEIMDTVTKSGYGPLHPFQAFELERFENGPIGREKTMEFCCRAIEICDEFWLFGISKGTLTELSHVIKWNSESNKPKIIKLIKIFDDKWEMEYEKLKKEFDDPLSKI